MSEAIANIAENAGDIEAHAARWLERRHFGIWEDGTQAEFDAWLNESSAHEVAYLRLDAAWGRTERLAALRPLNTEPVTDTAKSRTLTLLVGIAAAAAIFALVGMTAQKFFLTPPQDRTFATSVGGHKVVRFADGSLIELNTDTALRARMTTDQRTVWLDKGEAYFQVKHDTAHPFTVMVGNHRVMDLGTKFLIRRDGSRLEVAVAQGRVAFKASDERTPLQVALLSPGDAIVATSNSAVVRKISAEEIANELAWRRGVLVFKHTRLADAAAEFNRYNRIKLVVADMAAADRMIGATFPINDVERFARVAHDVLGLKIVYRSNEIVIQS